MNSISVVPGMASLAERYDGFIVDLWGVIHDGERLYPGVAETLQNLKKAGKPVPVNIREIASSQTSSGIASL